MSYDGQEITAACIYQIVNVKIHRARGMRGAPDFCDHMFEGRELAIC